MARTAKEATKEVVKKETTKNVSVKLNVPRLTLTSKNKKVNVKFNKGKKIRFAETEDRNIIKILRSGEKDTIYEERKLWRWALMGA